MRKYCHCCRQTCSTVPYYAIFIDISVDETFDKMSKINEKLTSALERMGLTENESRVYFAALSLGPSAVLQLSRAAGVKRTTVYSVLDSLKEKGLMGEEPRGFKTIYVATNPDKLKEVLDERKTVLEKHLGELRTIYGLHESEGTLRYYEGLEAVKTVYEDILADANRSDFYFAIANIATWRSLDQSYFDRFSERRAKVFDNAKILLTDSERARYVKQFERNFNQEVKILPDGTELSTSLIVTPKRLVIHQYVPIASAIVIQTKSAIQMQKELFEIIWKTLPKGDTPHHDSVS